MAQSWVETAVEGARELISRDLDAAEKRARELIAAAPDPSGVARAQAILIDIVAHRGHLEAALCLYEESREEAYRRRVSKAVRAEIELQGAHVLGQVGRYAAANSSIAEARRLLMPELERAGKNTSSGGRRRFQRLKRLEAASWLISATIALKDDPQVAFQQARKAATISEHEQIQISSLAVLAHAAEASKTPGSLSQVLGLVLEAERRLKRRRRPPALTLRQLRWNRARLLALGGLPEDGEALMVEVVDWLFDNSYKEDAKRARADLKWIRKLLAKSQKETAGKRRATKS